MYHLYTSRPSLLFSVAPVSNQSNSRFILYISTAKPFSLLVRGYIEVKIKTQLTLRWLSEVYQGNFQFSCRLEQLSFDTSAVILRKMSEIVAEKFFQLWICGLVYFIEISRNKCANTNISWQNWNILHSFFLKGTNFRFVDYKNWKSGHYTFILVQVWTILCQWPKRLTISNLASKHWITLLNQDRF